MTLLCLSKGKKKQTFKTSFIIYAYEKHYQIPENCVIADYSLFTQLNVLQFQKLSPPGYHANYFSVILRHFARCLECLLPENKLQCQVSLVYEFSDSKLSA